jgi:hypothetical protein
MDVGPIFPFVEPNGPTNYSNYSDPYFYPVTDHLKGAPVMWRDVSEGMTLETEVSSLTKESSYSRIQHNIFSNVIKSHTKTTLSMWKVKYHVYPSLDRRVPTICMLLGALFQECVSIFQRDSLPWYCGCRTKRLLSKIWELMHWSRVVWQNVRSW